MDVNILGSGVNSNVEAQVDPSRSALRVSLAPMEHTISGLQGGHYNLCAATGAMSALAASGQIFAVRWSDPSKLFILLQLAVSAVCTAFSSGTGADLEGIKASSYSSNASGGTQITPSTVSQMSRIQTMAPSSFNSTGEIRIATTTALTPGTQTLDTAGFGSTQIPATGAGGGISDVNIYQCLAFGQHPIILANNQGFVVREITTVPASNSFRYSIQMSWVEIAAF